MWQRCPSRSSPANVVVAALFAGERRCGSAVVGSARRWTSLWQRCSSGGVGAAGRGGGRGRRAGWRTALERPVAAPAPPSRPATSSTVRDGGDEREQRVGQQADQAADRKLEGAVQPDPGVRSRG